MTPTRTDLRRVKAITSILRTNPHIQSIKMDGDSVEVTAFAPLKEKEVAKALGAIKVPQEVKEKREEALDAYDAFQKNLESEYGMRVV